VLTVQRGGMEEFRTFYTKRTTITKRRQENANATQKKSQCVDLCTQNMSSKYVINLNFYITYDLIIGAWFVNHCNIELCQSAKPSTYRSFLHQWFI